MINELDDNTHVIHDFKNDLPDHSKKLRIIEEKLKTIKQEIYYDVKRKKLKDQEHNTFYERIIYWLDIIGQLSMPAFEVNDEIKEMYEKAFKKTPHIAKELWLDAYEKLHHPYNLLKNRAFKMLDELDQEYIKLNGRNPPNFNP